MASESLDASSHEHLHRRTSPRSPEVPVAVPTAPTGNPPRGGTMFPLGYKEGFSQWWASLPAAVTEHRLLSYVPYLQGNPPTHLQTGQTADSPAGRRDSLKSADHSQASAVEAMTTTQTDPYGPRRWRSSMVELSGKDRELNEFSVERVGEQADQHLVMVHGYGAGLGFFYKNFEPLSRPKGWQLHALDLLGMGRSTRPPFKIKAKNREDAIREAEDWFVDALEEWRIKRRIDRFTLLGHSMGGYMAVAYALKYPGHLNKLILASPVGVPEDPYAVRAELPEPSESTLANEFTQDQQDITGSAAAATSTARADNNTFLKTPSERQPITASASSSSDTKPPSRRYPKWFGYLWDANISPFSLIRWAGPLGPKFVSGWTSRRFSHLPADEAKALHDYAYSIFRLRGSGEYALSYILAPGAFARSPLIRRIQNVGRQMISPPQQSVPLPTTDSSSSTSSISATAGTGTSSSLKRETGIPIVFMYGDHDWMDVRGGYDAAAKLEAEQRRVLQTATPEERDAENGSAKVVVVKKAGHHLYLDGWQEFNEIVLQEMEDVARSERARAKSCAEPGPKPDPAL